MIKKPFIIRYRTLLGAGILFMAALAIGGCKGGGPSGSVAAPSSDTLDEDTSYAFGVILGLDLKDMGFHFNYEALSQGLAASIEGRELKISTDDALETVQTTYQAAITKRNEGYQEQETQFLAENSKKAGISITPSGLQYEVITQGSGLTPVASDRVRVNYKGSLMDGTVFDSSYEREEPTEFILNGVIPGWTEGIQLMNEGSTYRFYIPSVLAYGSQGAGNVIPPYAALIFEVELLTVIK
ncbi:MAG: FKBP-type peptidyl-prolyl cis-trans isomerase [Treponema sp.]|nr:FKBP-type peptidyl-prolyl cis-trans isomerase [Treponema sp.]